MPLRSRPLFLVPSLMRELPATGAVMFDAGAADGRAGGAATPACAAANTLLDQLEPLIVDANLAGYEITVMAAASGSGASTCLVISVETFLVEATSSTWDAVVTDVAVEWGTATGSVKAALGVRFEPRLAMRGAVDDGSIVASHYAIPFATPAGWIGSVDASTGGWLVATSTSPVSLPEDVTTIAGTPGEPESSTTKATALVEALRSAAAARWDVPDRQTTQLVECALAPLFDPSTWRWPAVDVGAKEVARIVGDAVWVSASDWVPSYRELAKYTLRQILNVNRRPVVRTLDDIRSALRNELVRRHLTDATTIDGSVRREGELGPRFDELYAAVEDFGTRRFALDLFRLLELGLISLVRRVADEEMLPAIIEREWTEPIVTGFYDSIGTITDIPIGDLADDDSALERFTEVAAEAAVVSINQAGDHLEDRWHERRFNPDTLNPVTVVTWHGGGERNHAAGGLVYDMLWVSERESDPSVTGSYTFTEVGGALEAVADWGGAPTTALRRRAQPRAVFLPGESTPEEPPADWVRPFWSDAEIARLPAAPRPAPGEPLGRGLRERVRDAEWYSLHPSEVILLDAIVGRLAADLDAIPTSGVDSPQHATMCGNLGTAFGYFVRDGREPSQLSASARDFVLPALLSMGGAQRTHLHTLAKAHAEMSCPNITTCLGIQQRDLAWLATDHVYRYKIHVRPTLMKGIKDVALEKIPAEVLERLPTRAITTLAKMKPFGPVPVLEAIEAEFQRVAPYDDASWPGTATFPESVLFDGTLVGAGIQAGGGSSTARRPSGTRSTPWAMRGAPPTSPPVRSSRSPSTGVDRPSGSRAPSRSRSTGSGRSSTGVRCGSATSAATPSSRRPTRRPTSGACPGTTPTRSASMPSSVPGWSTASSARRDRRSTRTCSGRTMVPADRGSAPR